NEAAGWNGACIDGDDPDTFLIHDFVKLVAEQSVSAKSLVPLGVNRVESGAGTYMLGEMMQLIFIVSGPIAEQKAMGAAYDPSGSHFDREIAQSRASAICWTPEAVGALIT